MGRKKKNQDNYWDSDQFELDQLETEKLVKEKENAKSDSEEEEETVSAKLNRLKQKFDDEDDDEDDEALLSGVVQDGDKEGDDENDDDNLDDEDDGVLQEYTHSEVNFAAEAVLSRLILQIQRKYNKLESGKKRLTQEEEDEKIESILHDTLPTNKGGLIKYIDDLDAKHHCLVVKRPVTVDQVLQRLIDTGFMNIYGESGEMQKVMTAGNNKVEFDFVKLENKRDILKQLLHCDKDVADAFKRTVALLKLSSKKDSSGKKETDENDEVDEKQEAPALPTNAKDTVTFLQTSCYAELRIDAEDVVEEMCYNGWIEEINVTTGLSAAAKMKGKDAKHLIKISYDDATFSPKRRARAVPWQRQVLMVFLAMIVLSFLIPLIQIMKGERRI